MKTNAKCKSRPAPSGQVLVLLGLGIFIMAVMVMMTLAITQRIKERMELQTLADASAYSEAIATARAFNGIAVMNRAMIGQMVAIAGTQALQNWTGDYMSALLFENDEVGHWKSYYHGEGYPHWWEAWKQPFKLCNRNAYSIVNDVYLKRLSQEMRIKRILYVALEMAASASAQARNGAAIYLYSRQKELLDDDLGRNKLGQQKLANNLLKEASVHSRWPTELSAPNGGEEISTKEVLGGFQCAGGGAACEADILTPFDMTEAAMGSVGWPFVSGRLDLGQIMQKKLSKNLHYLPWEYAFPPYDLAFLPGSFSMAVYSVGPTVTASEEGGTYWSDFGIHPAWFRPVLPWMLVSDSSWRLTFNYSPWLMEAIVYGLNTSAPSAFRPATVVYDSDPTHNDCGFIPFFSNVIGEVIAQGTTHSQLNTQDIPMGQVIPKHTMAYVPTLNDNPGALALHLIPFPSIYAFPWFVGYNSAQVTAGTNNYAQPKLVAVVQRDYGARLANPDAWTVPFALRVTGPGQELKLAGSSLADGTNISHQTAVSTGIAYYHRRQHFDEPPNLMNPYWRATLVAADTDNDGVSNSSKVTKDVGFQTGSDALDALNGAGFRGFH